MLHCCIASCAPSTAYRDMLSACSGSSHYSSVFPASTRRESRHRRPFENLLPPSIPFDPVPANPFATYRLARPVASMLTECVCSFARTFHKGSGHPRMRLSFALSAQKVKMCPCCGSCDIFCHNISCAQMSAIRTLLSWCGTRCNTRPLHVT